MICSKCGFAKTEEEEVDMYICSQCSTLFCSHCAEEQHYKCTKKNCHSDLKIIDSNLEYMLFDQSWRHIKKGGFS